MCDYGQGFDAGTLTSGQDPWAPGRLSNPPPDPILGSVFFWRCFCLIGHRYLGRTYGQILDLSFGALESVSRAHYC